MVVQCAHLEKYESQWEGWHPIYEMENKKCSKPPTSKSHDCLIAIECWMLNPCFCSNFRGKFKPTFINSPVPNFSRNTPKASRFFGRFTRKKIANDVVVFIYGGLHKGGYPQIIHFSGIFHYKLSTWECPHLQNPPYGTHIFSTKKLLNLNHPSSYPRLDTQPQMNRFSITPGFHLGGIFVSKYDPTVFHYTVPK